MDFIISRYKNKGRQLFFFPNGLAYFFGRNYEGLLKDSGMFCVHCLWTQCLWTQCLPSVGKTAAALGEMVPAAFISQDTSCTWSQQKSQLHQAHQPAGGGCAAPKGWPVVAGLRGSCSQPKLPGLTCIHPSCSHGTVPWLRHSDASLQRQTPTHGWPYSNEVFELLLQSIEVLGCQAYGLGFV